MKSKDKTSLDYRSLNRKFRELQRIAEQYELAMAGSATGIWDRNLLTDELFYSNGLKKLLGYDDHELADTREEFWDRLHPDDYQSAKSAIDDLLMEGFPLEKEFRLQTKTGEYRWFLARGSAFRDKTGKPIRASGSLTDITERKQIQEELIESEERFRNLMEQSPLAIEILTPEGKLSRVNAAWMRLWNISEEDAASVLAKYNMLNDNQVKNLGLLPLVERAFAGESVVLPPIHYKASRTLEDMGIKGSEAKDPWIQCHLYSVKNKKGEIQYVVNTYMDISQLKRTEEEAQEQRDRLARIGRTTRMGQLTGSIAHELNQPLTGILSNAQAAELMIKNDSCEESEFLEIMAEIVADTKRASEVIQNLQEVFREQKIEYLPVDIKAVIDETSKLLHSEFILQNVILTTDYATSFPAVRGNKIQIQQVLINLIMNAIQAMSGAVSNERRLHIAATTNGNDVEVRVEDCGPGIDPDRIDRIFEPMVTWKPGGTGMGLAISNSIIEAHGGRMVAENRSKGGARVGFLLPTSKERKKA